MPPWNHGDTWARVTEPTGGSVPKINTARATGLMFALCCWSLIACGGEGRIFFFSFASARSYVVAPLLTLLQLSAHAIPPGDILCDLPAVRH